MHSFLDSTRVIIESPYAGDTPELVAINVAYARLCVNDSLMRGEAPIASHLLYTQPGILDDTNPGERSLGIDAGHGWFRAAHRIAVYTDLGVSNGMQLAIERAQKLDLPIHYRHVGDGGRLAIAAAFLETPGITAPFPAQPDTNQEK